MSISEAVYQFCSFSWLLNPNCCQIFSAEKGIKGNKSIDSVRVALTDTHIVLFDVGFDFHGCLV